MSDAKRAALWFVPFFGWAWGLIISGWLAYSSWSQAATTLWTAAYDERKFSMDMHLAREGAQNERIEAAAAALGFAVLAILGVLVWRRFRPPLRWLVGYFFISLLLLAPAGLWVLGAMIGAVHG